MITIIIMTMMIIMMMMPLGGLESNEEARATFGYASINSYASLVLSQTPWNPCKFYTE